MVLLQMLDHLEFLLGSVRAMAAPERLLLGMGQVVMSKTCRPSESLLAQSTSIWTTVAVLLLVGLQYETSLEGFAAFLADIRARITVLCCPMYTQGICSVSSVVTLITGVGLLSWRQQKSALFFSNILHTESLKMLTYATICVTHH